MTRHIVTRNPDGLGPRQHQLYDVRSAGDEFWAAVTNVACPACDGGTVRWAEAGYVPGYRICDRCGTHFVAEGTAAAPALLRMRDRLTLPEPSRPSDSDILLGDDLQERSDA